jgi:hypothetical protein
MKPSSTKSANRHRRFPFRLQRIYPSSAPGRTCIVSDSGGHQSASGGSAGGSASGTPARNRHPSLSYLPFPHTHLTPYPLTRRRYCSSYTFSTIEELDVCNPYIPNEPNFKTPRLTVTLDMIRTYTDNCPKKHKKSKPNPNPIQTQPNPIFTPNFTFSLPPLPASRKCGFTRK